MKKEYKDRWVKALRSGDYKQGTSFLLYKKDNKQLEFCCLGVLCDILVGEMDVGWDFTTDNNYIRFSNECNMLPIEVQRIVGLDSFDPKLIDKNGEKTHMTTLNDEYKYTFPMFADLIETQF